MKIYHSLAQVFAARIMSIQQFPDAPADAGVVIHTDAEPVAVTDEWARVHKPVAGAYIVIGPKGAAVMTADELDAAYMAIGEQLLPGTVTIDTPPALTGVETFTFDQFVQYGRDSGANIVNGTPWSFRFHGYAVSHENDKHYLISGLGGSSTLHFTPVDLLQLTAGGAVSIAAGAAA